MGNTPSLSKTSNHHIMTKPHLGAAAAHPAPRDAMLPGLKNRGGNDCWANSLLQTIASSPSLTQTILFINAFLASASDAEIRQAFIGNPLPIATLRTAAETLVAQLETLIEDRDRGSATSEANTSLVRQALSHLLTLQNARGETTSPIKTRSVQHDSYEALQLIFGLYERCHDVHAPDAPYPNCYYSIVETKHFQPLEEFHPTTPEAIAFSRANPSDHNAHSIMPADGRVRREERQNVLLLEILPFRDAHFDLKRLPRSTDLDRQRVIEAEDRLFSQFLQMRFINYMPEASEPLRALGHDEDVLRSYRPTRIESSIREAPEELFFNITRFDASLNKIKNRDGSDVKVPIRERFTLAEEFAGSLATYELNSFIVHEGGIGGGHYYSYQKRNEIWYCCNDDHVSIPTHHQFQEHLGKSYLLQFKKLETIDQAALVISSTGPAFNPAPIGGGAGSVATVGCAGSATSIHHMVQSDKHIELAKKLDVKQTELSQLIKWSENFENGTYSFDSLPERIRNKLFEMLWVKDGMPQEWDYGRNKAHREPLSLLNPCGPVIHLEGSNLIEQMIQKETKEMDYLLAEYSRTCAIEFYDLFSSRTTLSRDTLNKAYEDLPDSDKELMLFHIAKNQGRFEAIKSLFGKGTFGEDEIKKDIMVLKAIIEDIDVMNALFSGLDLASFSVELITLLSQEYPNQDEIRREFDRLDQSQKNKIYYLVYQREVNLRALAYAKNQIASNIGYLSIKPVGQSDSPLDILRKHHTEAFRDAESQRLDNLKIHRDALESSTFTDLQKEEIKKRIINL